MPRMFSASYQRYSFEADWSATVPVAVGSVCKRDACAPVATAAKRIRRIWRSDSLIAQLTQLPMLDNAAGTDQHQYLEQQTISNPQQQYRFDGKEQHQSPTPTQLHRHQKTDATTKDIAH